MVQLNCINLKETILLEKFRKVYTTICETLPKLSNEENVQRPNYDHFHLEVPQMPMHFTAIDLKGPFENTSKGNQITL